jgi:hypothetical protein
MERASFSLGRRTPARSSTLIPVRAPSCEGLPRAEALRSFYISLYNTICVVSCSRTRISHPSTNPPRSLLPALSP